MDEDIWGNENEDNKAPDINDNDDTKTNPFSSNYKQEDDDELFANNNESNGGQSTNINNNDNNNDDPAKNNLLSYYDVGLDGDSEIRIVDTEERKGRVTKYTVYIIESSIFGTKSVARRYNDFKWLYQMLGIEFISVFIPSLPPSNTFERFKDEIISQRRFDLERFLNRINESKVLKTSSLLELFLCEQDEQTFEEQKKINNKIMKERTDYDLLSLLMRNFSNIDNEEIPSHLIGFNNDNNDKDNDDLYQLDIPRVREFFQRCDERLSSLNKVCNNLFKIFAHISDELNIFNQSLNELYDAEYNNKPNIMLNKCQERYNIRDFMNKWKEFEDINTNNFYKYFLLSLRYEHEDVKSLLESFKRYDNIYNRYKKIKQQLIKQKDKYPDKDASDLENQLNETKNLLDIVCKIILINQTPKLWNDKLKNYNKAIATYIENITQKPL